MKKKTINYAFKKFNSYNTKEILAANKVIKTGNLSGFIAGNEKSFYGGKYVKLFEKKIKSFFKVKYAITVNSWTSGLVCAVGALDINPGDEILVTPWSMCATATSILHWNCIPVFIDIEPDMFCLDVNKIEKKITSKTKGIIVADIFGQSSDIFKIIKLAKKHNIKVICDSAQAIGSKINNKFTGTISDIGGFSLNYHKHIHTGEGGIIITNNKILARRMQLIRNHAEAGVTNKDKISNMIGHNFRMGEIEAAIGIEQLKKLPKIIKKKISDANFLTKMLAALPYLKTPKVRDKCSHVYYVYPLILDIKKIGFKRSYILNLLNNEGLHGFYEGYSNILKLPMYKFKKAYGNKNFPWSLVKKENYNYDVNNFPILKDLDEQTMLSFEICLFDLSKKDLKNIFLSFEKVWKKLNLI